jgi:hypothetical protein
MKAANRKTTNFLRAFLISAVLLSSFESISQAPDWEWAKSDGGLGYDRGQAITYSSDGNLLVCGYFQGTATFDTIVLTSSFTSDLFLAKYTFSGSLLWVRSVAGSSSYPEPEAIYEDISGNIYITGTFGVYSSTGGGGDISFNEASTFISWGNQDIFLAKFDAEGEFDWAKHIGSIETDKSISTMDYSGNFILSGKLWNTVYFNSTVDTLVPYHMFDIFIAKYDASGVLVFYRNATSCTAVTEPQDITLDDAGGIYLAGKYNGKPTFGLPVDTVDLEEDLYYEQGFIAKFESATGLFKWAYTAGNTMTFDYPYTLNSKSGGKIVMSGKYLVGASFGILPDTLSLIAPPAAGYGENYIVQFDTSGNADWAINAGHATAGGLNIHDSFYHEGNLFLAGDYSAGPAIFGEGSDAVTITPLHAFFVANYDDSGNLDWVNHAGGFYYEGAESVTADALNNVYITGFFLSGCVFPGTSISLISEGFEDILVARLNDAYVSINEKNNNWVGIISPNPASSYIIVNTENFRNCIIQIIDLQGNVLRKKVSAQREEKIDISNFPKGIYIINLTDQDRQFRNYKLIKI